MTERKSSSQQSEQLQGVTQQCRHWNGTGCQRPVGLGLIVTGIGLLRGVTGWCTLELGILGITLLQGVTGLCTLELGILGITLIPGVQDLYTLELGLSDIGLVQGVTGF